MKSATKKRTPEEQAELERIYETKFKSHVWDYFKYVKRIRRPYELSDFERGYFIPDDL